MRSSVAVGRGLRRRWLLLACLAGGACCAGAPFARAGGLRAGFAETEITPPLDFPMAGYYHERLATGTRDPLLAKALVLQGDETSVAVVACDLCGVAYDLTLAIRQRVAQETDLPPEHVIVCATHSHTSPDYTRDLYEYLGDTSAGPAPVERYARTLIEQAAQAVIQAYEVAEPIEVATGPAQQETPISFNRRFVTKDGSVRTWLSLADPQVVRPAGPIDPEAGLVLCRAADDGQPLGLVSNFALHLDTVGGTQWSGDYPYFVQECVRAALGPQTVSLFGLGCCGDINHVDPGSKERNQTDFIGTSLGQTIVAALPQLAAVPDPALRVGRAVVPVPLAPIDEASLPRADELVRSARAGRQQDFFELVTAYKTLHLDQLWQARGDRPPSDLLSWGLSHAWHGVGGELPVEVHAVCLGSDTAIVFLPGEVFVELGLAIKRGSPFRQTLVVELSNCVETLYIPTRAAYAGGSYEVTNSALQPGGGEMLVEAALKLLREAATAANAATAR